MILTPSESRRESRTSVKPSLNERFSFHHAEKYFLRENLSFLLRVHSQAEHSKSFLTRSCALSHHYSNKDQENHLLARQYLLLEHDFQDMVRLRLHQSILTRRIHIRLFLSHKIVRFLIINQLQLFGQGQFADQFVPSGYIRVTYQVLID